MQVSDQLTGMLEVRAKTDEAAAAGQDIIQGFLTEPDAGAVYRSPCWTPAVALHRTACVFSTCRLAEACCVGSEAFALSQCEKL